MAGLYGWAIKISWLGADHTYVTSSDGGVWGCWGRSSGGRTICSGTGSSRRANCLSQSSSHAGIIYGVTGVCHQTANRVLYPARVVVSSASGYWASVTMYGTYGTQTVPSLIEWEARKARCNQVSGDLGLRALAVAPEARAKAIKEPAPEPVMRAYLDKVDAIYVKHAGEMRMSALPGAKKIDFLARELELMADYRVGAAMDSKKITALQKLQGSILHEKEGLDEALIGKDISAGEYAQKVNGLMAKFMKESGAQLGTETHTKMFGMPPDAVFQIVDAKILARYHKE
jgi:hypothetical protein